MRRESVENKTVLEMLERHTFMTPDRTAVICEPQERISYKELWELSGCLYSWIKKRGIGAEDIVMFCLPRGISLFACMIGTMRAGAAFVLAESGNIIAEVSSLSILDSLKVPYTVIAEVKAEPYLSHRKMRIGLREALDAYEGTLSRVFPIKSREGGEETESPVFLTKKIHVSSRKCKRPKVFIPVFPGTNCEYDSMRAFERAGAETEIRIFRNLSESDIRESVGAFKKAIDSSEIIMFPGGFSAGDEPDGSAKFFATAFRNEDIRHSVDSLLERDGLILGICNGFQALIKLGLVPYGRIIDFQTEDSPTLTFNTINRHISRMAYTKVVSNKSPWLSLTKPGRCYVSPASHGEGRFVASDKWMKKLFDNGQVALQYSDPEGKVSMDESFNINGSFSAVEGITDDTGRILGKMCHAERRGEGVNINIYGEQDLKIFEAGVKYFG